MQELRQNFPEFLTDQLDVLGSQWWIQWRNGGGREGSGGL